MRFWITWSVLSAVVLGACAVGEELAFTGSSLPSTSDGPDGGSTTVTGRASTDGVAGAMAAGGAGAASGSYREDAAAPANSLGGSSGSDGNGGSDLVGDAAAIRDRTSTDTLVAVDSASGCVATQKSCGDRCVLPSPSVGCGLTGCTSCPAPLHATPRCAGVQCDFDCDAGYVRSGAGCVAGGGSDGPVAEAGPRDAGTSDGTASTCMPMQCGGCIPVIQAPCCKSATACGCQYPFAPCM